MIGRKRLPEFPAEHEFKTVIVSNREPKPEDAPDAPRSVHALMKSLEAAGWSVNIGYSRAWRKGQRTGTYRRAEFFGVYGFGHSTSSHRIQAIYWRFVDKTETFGWFRDVMALELLEKPSGEAGTWTWQDGRIVDGIVRHRVKVTDIKEFAMVRGSVLPSWFEGIAKRFAEQATKALCGELVEHEAHAWDTTTGIAKMCSGKASKPKEVEAA